MKSMERTVIRGTKISCSRIAYGVGALRSDWRDDQLDAAMAKSILAAHDNSITLFDTADVYVNGRSELALGRVIRESPGFRKDITVQTKCGLKIREGWTPDLPIDINTFSSDLSKNHIVESVNESLIRLDTDWIDILLLHTSSALMEPEEIARAFYELAQAGKVLHFGTCMYTPVQIDLLQSFLDQPLVISQIHLGLAHSSAINGGEAFGSNVDFCRLRDIQIQAFSPLKAGDIFDKPLMYRKSSSSDTNSSELTAAISDVAARYGASGIAVMLAWILRHPAGIIPIIGATRAEHIAENCAALSVNLSVDDWEVLRRAAVLRHSG